MTSIQMPQLGETIIEGTILKWLKQVGDHVERDEALFEISTDKVDTEVPSPVDGTVTKILVAEGTTVAVGAELMEIAEDGAGVSPAPAAPPEKAAPAVAAIETPAAPVAVVAAPAAVAGTALPDRGPRSQILSPLVRRLAKEHGLDLAAIAGTGEGGRITKADVQAAIAAAGGAVATPTAATAGVGEELVPMTHIRKAIAQHMVSSNQISARAWTMVEVNVDHLVKLRERAKDLFAQKYGVKLTYLPMVVRATTDALLEYPDVNARLDGETIVRHRYVHMAIAVSYDQGLIVPVVKDVDGMNTVGIARAIADLAARARSHELKPDEVQGGTFTITNPGPYGSIASVPIINQPNVAILSLDAIVKRPVVIDDAIAIRSMVNISMSWDHRVVDGELATRFLTRVKENLENWDFAEDLGL